MFKRTRKGIFVVAHSGRNLGGPFKTQKAANKRMAQVEFFKKRGKKK